MEIKAGREYRTASGEKANGIHIVDPDEAFPARGYVNGMAYSWMADGRFHSDGRGHYFDLIAEWSVPPQPDADGWIEWKGGGCPVPPETVVEVRYRNDLIEVGPSRIFGWKHPFPDRNYDIIAYRIVTPAPKAADSEHVAELVAKLEAWAKKEDDVAVNSDAVTEALAGQMAAFEARTGHNVYAVRLAVDHASEAKTARKQAALLREAIATLSQLSDALRAGEVGK